LKLKASADQTQDPRPLRTRAYDDLKDSLLRGQYLPGSLLSERRLAAEFGMSKTPIRAALERLEAEGYIAITPQQGILVRELSVQELADQFELRAGLEPYVLRKLAGALLTEQIARLETNLKQQGQTLKSGDTAQFIRLDGEFHLLFCEFLGNHEIVRVMTQLRDKILRLTVEIAEKKDSERPAETYKEHRQIAEAVITGDGDEAARSIVAHLEAGQRYVLLPNQRVIRPSSRPSE
jgi:DNA-binding GntR family transcriptional regulator